MPLRVAEDAGAIAALAAEVAGRCRADLRPDAVAAAELAAAAARTAARLVEVNLTAGPEDERARSARAHAERRPDRGRAGGRGRRRGLSGGSRLGESLSALRAVFANPDLRRVQIAWFGANIGHYAYFVGISVYAFAAGGAGAVGVAAVVRMVPAAIATPFGAALADRYRRERVMVASDISRALVLAATAGAILADAPAAVAIGLAAVAGILYTPFEPAKSALIPTLARTPEELTAANLASSTTESVTIFAGAALTGAILAVSGTAEAMLFSVACMLWSAWFVSRIHAERPERECRGGGPSLAGETAAGFRAIAADRRLALVIGLMVSQTLVFGAFSVLVVVLAVDMLGIGDAGVGYLNSAVGIGAFIGAGVALGLIGNRRLARGLGVGVALWGAPLVAVGLLVDERLALAMMAVIGLANTLVDVSAMTLLQRIAPEQVLARVFGVMETLIIASIAIGSLLAPLLIDQLGNEGAFIAVGALLPVLTLVSWASLRRLDASAPAPTARLELLESVPLFAPLGPVALEELAARSVEVHAGDGEEIVTQGDPGKRFYVVVSGEIEVTVDGEHVRTEGPGAHFGEIALLRDVPRTATVSARGEVELCAIERQDFIDAVTGETRSSAAAEAVIGVRLGRARPGA